MNWFSSLNLRQRLALVLVAWAVVSTTLLAMVLWSGYQRLEGVTLERILGRELVFLVENGTSPSQVNWSRTGLRFFRPAFATGLLPPPQLEKLAPGSYRDYDLSGITVHVLVSDINEGDRAWLVYDVSAFESREAWVKFWLFITVLAAAGLSWFLSGRLADATLAPLSSLVTRITGVHPGDRERLPVRPEDGELSVIVNALNQHMNEIDDLVTRERAFAAAAAHELRTPLTSIRIAGETLGGIHGVPAEPVARIGRGLASISETLDALLALSRSREPPVAENLRVDLLLRALAEPYVIAARENGTTLSWGIEPLTAPVPRGVMGIIFTNLLRNAIRAAPKGMVRIELVRGWLAVMDNGKGIHAEDLAYVLEPGTRGKHGGSGIGLYISRVLAERCGWQLRLSSEEGAGTTAELRFAEIDKAPPPRR